MPDFNELTLSSLQPRVHQALRQWHADSPRESPLASLILFQQLLREASTNPHQATNQLILQALLVLEEGYKRDAILLRRSFLNNELDEFIANDMNIASSTFYRHKPEAERRLTEVLLKMEQSARTAHRTRLLQRLSPPSYTNLLGIEEHLAHLEAHLTSPEAPWIVALAGIGGIGKTSLADAVVRRLIERGATFDVGWVTARQLDFGWDSTLRPVTEPALTFDALVEALTIQLAGQLAGESMRSRPLNERLMLLRGQLKERPHLIVVDNLETLADVEALVSTLRDLAMPTKFLLTSREGLYSQPDIYHYAVPELSPADSIRLIRQEARQRNLSALLQASDEDLHAVVEVVGGNPLAIRLVTGQIYVYTMEVVLDNLLRARGTQIENLYTFIYRTAWDRLDELTRRVFVAMPLAPTTGATLSYLAQISTLKEDDLTQALEMLVRLNLVDVRGDLRQRRYSIHGLTRSFLHEQVLRWQ